MFQTKTDISIIRPHTHKLVHYYTISREADCSVSVRVFPTEIWFFILMKYRNDSIYFLCKKISVYVFDC